MSIRIDKRLYEQLRKISDGYRLVTVNRLVSLCIERSLPKIALEYERLATALIREEK